MKRVVRFVTAHPVSVVVFFVCLYLAFLLLAGCTSTTRIEPASNSTKVETAQTPTTETIKVKVGGREIPQ